MSLTSKIIFETISDFEIENRRDERPTSDSRFGGQLLAFGLFYGLWPFSWPKPGDVATRGTFAASLLVFKQTERIRKPRIRCSQVLLLKKYRIPSHLSRGL